MDVFGHSFEGVLLARIAAPQDSPAERRYYLGVCIGASLLPDMDAISYLWGPDAFALVHQRYTHTIFALIVLPPLFALFVRMVHKRHTWLKTYLLSLAAMIVHISSDLIAHWPVEFFYPLSRKGWTLGLIRKDFSLVADLILITGSLVTFYDKAVKYRRSLSLITIFLLVGYLLFGPGY